MAEEKPAGSAPAETITTKKQRDYMFDTFRGILMLSIPISHFTKASGNWYAALYGGAGWAQTHPTGFVYITINVFVMQAFMFLSGYFSKKPERARETAFRGILWPYLVFTTITLIAAWGFDCPIGKYFGYLTPSFALWFLVALFLYRYFLVEIVKFKWALPMSIIMMLAAGVLPFGQFMALGRVFSYFPFFLVGYYCSKETLDMVRTLKKKPVLLALLGAVLVGMSIWLMYNGPTLSWFLLKEDLTRFGHTWYTECLWRLLVFGLSAGWIAFMVNILPSKQNFLCYIGTNTMPIYLFHLGLRHVITQYNVYMGVVGSLIVAWFAGISLLHKKHNNWAVSIIITVLSIVGVFVLCMSGVLDPLAGGCPKNLVLFYILVWGSALLTGVSLAAPFWVKLYDLLTEGPLRASFITEWLEGKYLKKNNEEAK